MIDPTRSPQPAWRRYLSAAVLGVLIVVAGYVIYTKDLKHSGSGASQPVASAPAQIKTTSPKTASKPAVAPTTTIPGGVAPSSRNPFAP